MLIQSAVLGTVCVLYTVSVDKDYALRRRTEKSVTYPDKEQKGVPFFLGKS